MISPFRVFRWYKLSIVVAAWATPFVIRWWLKRQENRREGQRHLQVGNWSEAVRYLTPAVAQSHRRWWPDRERLNLTLQLAEAHRNLGNFDEARAVVDWAEGLTKPESPEYRRCLDARSAICADDGQLTEARRLTREAVRQEPSWQRYQCLAHIERRLGDGLQARRLLHKALQLSQGETLDTANLLADLGDAESLERAALIHERVLGAGSGAVIHDLVQLGVLYRQAGDMETALARLERALRLKERQVGGTTDELVVLLRNLSEMYASAGCLAPAIELLQRASVTLQNTPDERLPQVLDALGALQQRSGRADDACRCYQEAAQAWNRAGAEFHPKMLESVEKSQSVQARSPMLK